LNVSQNPWAHTGERVNYFSPLMPSGARKYAIWQFAKPLLNNLIVLAI
jgi:hypothetical protein